MLKLVTLIGAAAAIGTAALAPLDNIPDLQNNPIGMILVVFLVFTSAIYFGYFLFNIASALLGQGDAGRNPVLYWVDYFPSWLAWLSLNLTLLWVVLGSQGIVQGYEPITSWADVPNKYLVLFALALFSWFDVFILQGHKHDAALQYIRTQRAIVPAPAVAPAPAAAPLVPPLPAPAPVPVAAPTNVGRAVIILVGIVIVALLLAIFFSSTRTGNRIRHSLLDDRTAWSETPTCTSFVGKTDRGANFYWLKFDGC